MKKKLLVIALMVLSIACLLVACNTSTNYDGMTKITFEPEGGVYQNCTLPFYQYYDFKDGTTNLIREPAALSRKEFAREGYTFVGWFKTRTEVDGKVTYSDMWDFATDKVGTDGVTLYACWEKNVTVTYLYNVCYVDEQGQTQIIGSYDVLEGDEFDDYESFASKRSGYTAFVFKDEDTGYWDDGYYLDAECTQPVKGYKHPGGEEDTAINVYVKYIKGEYTLVRTASELVAARSNDVYLLEDIDMKGATLSFENYGGVFEGNGHTISNFAIAYNAGNNDLKFNFDDNSGDTAVHAGLFENLSGATLRNIKFSGATFTVDGGTSKIKKIYFAPFCMSAADSKIENVSIEVSYKIVSGPMNNKDFDFASDFKVFAQGYRTAENTDIVDFDVKTSDNKATYTLSINKDDNTYTMAENRVTITYVNDKVTVASASVFRNVSTTLYAGDDLTTVDGFKFRGWFDNAEYSGSAKTSVTPTGDVTFYAKYDAAVTLTFDYSGYEYESGKTTYVVPDKFANDTIDTLPTVDASVRHEEKAFAGWFYKNEDGSFGNQATPSDKLSGNTTVYAKWVDAPKSYGTFKGFEIWNAKSYSKTSLSTEVLKVAVNGSFTGVRSISGTLSETDAAIANGAINVGRYAYLSDALGGIVIVGYNSSDTSVGADFYIGFRNYANITSVDYSVDTIGGGYVAFLTVNYSENGTAKSMNLLVFKDRIYADVAWASGVTAKNAATTDSFLITDASGNVIAKKSGSEMLGNDGKGGAYNNTDAYGEIALDGYGTLTVGGQQVAYTLDGNKVTFVIDNTMRVITLGDGVYTKTLDGYEGTYTLPDASTLALDGYGNVTDTSKTYVVSGNNITIYDGETSVKYGLDVDNKALLGKSVFAGYKFSGDSMSITFDDSSSISGTILNGTTYSGVTLKFTATFDGTTLTITIANANGVSWNNGSTWTSNSDFDGKTIVMKLSGNELSVVSSTTTSLGYSFNDKAVTCEGFSR